MGGCSVRQRIRIHTYIIESNVLKESFGSNRTQWHTFVEVHNRSGISCRSYRLSEKEEGTRGARSCISTGLLQKYIWKWNPRKKRIIWNGTLPCLHVFPCSFPWSSRIKPCYSLCHVIIKGCQVKIFSYYGQWNHSTHNVCITLTHRL